MIDAILDITVHKCRKIVDRIVYTVIGHAALREVVSADLCRTVTCADHCFSTRCNVIEIFLMLFVVYECSEAGERTFLVFRLVACLGTFDQYLLDDSGVGILPIITQTYAGLHFVDVLTSGSA